jgi:transposase-like protein
MDKQPLPETMIEAVRQFADPQVAHDFWVQMRWPNGVACPLSCGSVQVAYMPKRRRWYCNDCKGQFTAKVGTIFEDSPIGFDKWLPAIWLIASNRNGISSHELARALQVTQKTAWFMLHRIREAMQSESYETPLSGTVEVDEAYIGGRWENKPLKVRRAKKASQHWESKTAVLGMVERKGHVRAYAVPNVQQDTLLPKLRASIDQDATVYTDAATLYTHIKVHRLRHALEEKGLSLLLATMSVARSNQFFRLGHSQCLEDVRKGGLQRTTQPNVKEIGEICIGDVIVIRLS